MFTNNYILYKNSAFLGNGFTGKTKSGNNQSFHYSYYHSADIGSYMHQAYAGVVPENGTVKNGYVQFGTGSTPATRGDYNLENPITSGLSIVGPSKTQLGKVEEGHYCAWASYTVSNTSSDTIHIYEIGAFLGIGTSSASFYNLLMERTVLDEPIVIEPGDEKIVTYKITFNQ